MASHKSKPVNVGYNYSANVALLLCMGPVQGLYQVFAGDTLIWPTGKSNADLDLSDRLSCNEAINAGRSYSVLNTSLGTIRFYWGFPDSQPDPDLSAITSGGMVIGAPAYRWYAKAICIDLQFGASQSPPNLTFVLDRPLDDENLVSHWPWRWRYKTAFTPDCYLADVVASMLSNPIYGAGIDLSILNEASFEAANHDSDSEGSGLSPLFDSASTLKQLLGTLLPYYNAYLYYDQGQIYLTIPRPQTGAVPLILGASMLTEEPDLDMGSYFDTWGETRVSYTDRTLHFQTNVAAYHDAANEALVGTTVQKGFDRPFLTRQDLAQRSAEQIGLLNGVPTNTGKLILRSVLTNLSPDVMATYPDSMKLDASTIRASAFVPGQLINFNYPPLNIESMLLRITKVTIQAPTDGTVEIDVQSDASIAGSTAFYQPTVTAPPVFDELPPAPVTARMGALTSQQLDSSPDGVLICANRPNELVTSYELRGNWNTVTDFGLLSSFSSFAIQATLNRWRRSDTTGRILVDVTLADAIGQAKLADYKTSMTDLYFVAMTRRQVLHAGVDQHQLTPGWAHLRIGGTFTLVSANRWLLEVEPGSQASQAFILEQFRTPADGYWPTSLCWLGNLSDFGILPVDNLYIFEDGGNDPSDVAEKRYLRLPSRTPDEAEDIGDATQLEFDRLDTTMNPAGTMSPDWGVRCDNREYVTLVCKDGATNYWRMDDIAACDLLALQSGQLLNLQSGDEVALSTTNILLLQNGQTFELQSGDGFGLHSMLCQNYLNTNDGAYATTVVLREDSPLSLEIVTGSATFNGSSACLDLGNFAGLQLAIGSLECWVKTTAPGAGRRCLLSKYGAFDISLIDGKPSFRDWSTTTDNSAAATIADGGWHHLALTWQSGVANGAKLYIDGALAVTGIFTISSQANPLLAAGERQTATSPSSLFDGSLDEIAMYPIVLTADLIAAHHQAATDW